MNIINQAINDCNCATIIGDINVDLLKSDSGCYADGLKVLCDENYLEQLIHQPTRIQPLNTAGGWVIQE